MKQRLIKVHIWALKLSAYLELNLESVYIVNKRKPTFSIYM